MLSWTKVRWLTWLVQNISLEEPWNKNRKQLGCLSCMFTIIFSILGHKIEQVRVNRVTSARPDSPSETHKAITETTHCGYCPWSKGIVQKNQYFLSLYLWCYVCSINKKQRVTRSAQRHSTIVCLCISVFVHSHSCQSVSFLRPHAKPLSGMNPSFSCFLLFSSLFIHLSPFICKSPLCDPQRPFSVRGKRLRIVTPNSQLIF